ncbi:MAG: DNA-damage-inducible protein J [Planctomycetota bacterium]|jgi:DNA-damage-inducible protein J
MSKNTHVQARVSPELKEQADAILNAMGLKTAEAIRLFLQQVVNTGGLPFQPRTKVPNADTIDAIKEMEEGGGKVYNNPEALFDKWEKE